MNVKVTHPSMDDIELKGIPIEAFGFYSGDTVIAVSNAYNDLILVGEEYNVVDCLNDGMYISRNGVEYGVKYGDVVLAEEKN